MARAKTSVSKNHPLMRDMDTYLLRARWKTREGYLKPNKKIIPDIFVTPACVEKSISFANTLFIAFAKEGYEVHFAGYDERPFYSPEYDILEDESKTRRFKDIWSPSKSTIVDIGGVMFGIKIFEMLIEETAIYLDGDYIRLSEFTPALERKARYHHTWESVREYGSGRLCLMFYSYDKWTYRVKEVKGQKLEKQITEIIQHLKDSVPELLEIKERLRQEREQREREWEEDKRRRAIEQEQEIITKATEKSRQWVNEIIENWGEAMRVHNFFNSIEEDIKQLDEPRRSHLLDRARLAKELVGTVDPLDYMAQWKTPDEIIPILKKRRDLNYWEEEDDEDLLGEDEE
jgi:hypothetical protein